MAAMAYGRLWDFGVAHVPISMSIPEKRVTCSPHLWDPMIFTWPAFVNMYVFSETTIFTYQIAENMNP